MVQYGFDNKGRHSCKGEKIKAIPRTKVEENAPSLMVNLNGQGRIIFRRQNQQSPLVAGTKDYFYFKIPCDWGRQVEWKEILREGQTH